MTQYGFYFDSTRCIGCKACEMACKDYKDLEGELLFRRVYDFEGGEWTQDDAGCWTTTAVSYHVSNACNHCANPTCVQVCPTGAMRKDPETGLVFNDPDVCIGCGSCVAGCPYTAPRLDSTLNISRKCDGCYGRVATGKSPICVEACTMRALFFGDIDELRAEYGELADLAPLPESSQTGPSLVLRSCPAAESAGAVVAEVTNPAEV